MKTILAPLLDDLRSCLCDRLGETEKGEGCFCGLYPGPAAVADFCSCSTKTTRPGQPALGGCGMAWVRLDRVFASSVTFPSPDPKPSCTTVLAAVIEVGVYRCVPRPNAQGIMDPVALTQAALDQVADADAMVRAIRCCDAITKRPHVLGTYLPTPSGGDCGGGTWPVTVQLLPR